MPAALPDIRADLSPLLAERHVALAVSGGSDSIALMRLAASWAATHHPTLCLSVLTVDHGLRTASAAEAEQVNRWAGAIGLPHQTLTWSAKPPPRSGIQAKAREARYGLMADWCRSSGATLLLTAHTLDDQAETVLMRLSRTMAPEALAGIRCHGAWDGFPLFRPLLKARRVALRDYLSRAGQGWIDDPSNEDPRFERVRVRQSLVALGGTGVTAERLSALSEAGARTFRLMDDLCGRWLRRWLEEGDAGVCRFPAAPFTSLPPPLKERILACIIHHYGGGQFQPEAEELRRLALWMEQGGQPRCTLGGAVIGRRAQGFWITREAARIDASPVLLPEGGEIIWDKRFRVTGAPGSCVTPAGARKPPLAGQVPVFARRAYPWVEPAGAGITFLPLISSAK